MEDIYPAGPSEVPEAFTRPGASYRRHAWVAVAGLLLFVVLYFALTAWFILAGLNELAKIGSEKGFLPFVVGVANLFLALFMVKALFFIKKGAGSGGVELKRADQPRLFGFLDRVADDAGAPRPHKVFVTQGVNAAVFYDLSLLNLLFPSRKNLEIGLGLVNMLNLGELKAVLAHEFGHFAQRSMAVGRWVYTTQQIASHIVAKRDALDGFLRQLSRFDLRIAWVGWLLSLVIWALRAVVDAVFRLVVIAQRALSREMEMQADLVAVSLTGSDALVQALHRLQMADDAWDRSLNFLRGEVNGGRPPRDLFEVHQALAERLCLIYNDPDYGVRPQVPEDGAAGFRMFKGELAQPPRMWSTHPMNHEREENAKRTYLFAPADERSAWLVFDDAPALRERMTRELIGATEHPVAESSVTLKHLDDQFGSEHLKPCYRGLYLGLSAVRHASEPDALYRHVPVTRPLRLDELYPESIGEELERLRSLEHEHALLCSLRDRIFDAPDGVIRHRGRILKRNELPAAIASVDDERKATRASIEATLNRVRSMHLRAAEKVSPPWAAYLKGLLALLHYADHTEANLRDAQAGLANWWRRATANGSINERGVRYILAAASDVHRAMAQVFALAADVRPGERILAELGQGTWPTLLGGYGLKAPVRANINEWLRLVDRWVAHTAGWLAALRRATLDELLRAELIVAAASHGTTMPEPPTEIPSVPMSYDTLVIGHERGRKVAKPSLWERFQTASGFVPGLARAVVAVAIVGSVLLFGWAANRATITVYNGLARGVVTTIDGHRVAVPANGHVEVGVNSGGDVSVETKAADGEPIETFSAPVDSTSTQIVYNVASARPLRLWTAAYGHVRATAPRLQVPVRWQKSDAEFLFKAPPDRIQTKDDGGTRTVLDAGDNLPPDFILDQIHDKPALDAMLLAHVRFDSPDTPYLLNWLGLASSLPGFDQAFASRRAHFPLDVVAMRLEQDLARRTGRGDVCERDRALAKASPAQPDLAYLSVRCMAAGSERDLGFREGHRRWPDSPWFANAAGAVESEDGHYDEALADFRVAIAKSPVLRQVVPLEALRLERLLHPEGARQKQIAYARMSPMVANILLLERGTARAEGPWRAFAMLSNGQLDEAVRAATGTPMAAHVLRMAAGSDGASRELRAKASALPSGDGVDDQTVWLALAAGDNVNDPAVSRVLEQVEKGYDTPGAVDKVKGFLNHVRHGDVAGAERVLDGVPMQLRAQAFVAGAYLLGKRTPEAWRTYARSVLFSAERPYMG